MLIFATKLFVLVESVARKCNQNYNTKINNIFNFGNKIVSKESDLI